MRETQPKGFEEAQSEDLLKGEMAKDFIPMANAPWKEMRGIVKWKNGQPL